MAVKGPLLALSLLAAAAAGGGEKDELREALGDRALVGPWIYDDLEAGISLAKESGKPLMVVLRCVT